MNFLTRLIKFSDSIFGPILIKAIPTLRRKKFPPDSMEQILVIRPGGIGDAALLLPVLKTAVKANPDLKIDILCEHRNKGVFNAVPFIRQIYSYQSIHDVRLVLRNCYDIVIDTEQSHLLSAGMVRLLNPAFSAGFDTNGRKKCYHTSIQYRQNCYEADMFCSLFRHLGIVIGKFHFNPPYFKSLSDGFDPCIGSGLRYICLFPGASIQERLWPEQRWAQVIDRLADHGFYCVLLGGGSEASLCHSIISHCHTNQVLNMCQKLSLLETTGIFEKAGLLISTDSGLLHLGVLCQVPTVSLFGPGIAAKWAPTGKRNVVIDKVLPCSPCTRFGTTPPCPNNKQCMLSIEIEDVINAALSILRP